MIQSMVHNGRTIAVIGLGHVGLPTALGLAEAGWTVVGSDACAEKAHMLAGGIAPFYEPGVDQYLSKHLQSGRFRVAETVEDAVEASTVVFVCVGTPQTGDGQPDLFQVEAVARSIGQHLNGYTLIVEKSTTPVRTADRIKQAIRRYGNDHHEFDVAVNPEFLQEGMALHDILHPDRIVLGVESERAQQLLEEIYRPILDRFPGPGGCSLCDRLGRNHRAESRLVVTDPATAELIKHASNAFLSTKISFINMIADLCEAMGADVTKVAHGLGLDPRIGGDFLEAGIGFGGYCLPKDLQALMWIGTERGVDVSLLEAVAGINNRRIDRFCEKVRQALWVIRGKTIGVLGLAFKPGTDDIREAPSLKIIARLLAGGAALRLHDPKAMDNVRQELPDEPGRVTFCASPYDAAEGAHALVLLTEWDQYHDLDWHRIRKLVEVPIFIDGRNFLDPGGMRDMGFEYYGCGNVTERRRAWSVRS